LRMLTSDERACHNNHNAQYSCCHLSPPHYADELVGCHRRSPAACPHQGAEGTAVLRCRVALARAAPGASSTSILYFFGTAAIRSRFGIGATLHRHTNLAEEIKHVGCRFLHGQLYPSSAGAEIAYFFPFPSRHKFRNRLLESRKVSCGPWACRKAGPPPGTLLISMSE
jgi:hypothetical protein